MAKKEAIKVYATEWLVAEEVMPSISYSEAEKFFHTVCELKGIKNISIKQNLHRKGAICRHFFGSNTHQIQVGKISPLTEMLILHEIAHSFFPDAGHNSCFVSIFENLMKEFLPNKVMERWNYYRSQIKMLRTKEQISKFYSDKMEEMKKVS